MKYIVLKIRDREALVQGGGLADPSTEDIHRSVMSRIIEYGVELKHDAEIVAEFDRLPDANKAADEWNNHNESIEKTDGNAGMTCFGITTAIVACRPETAQDNEELEDSGNIVLDDTNGIFMA